MKRSLLILLAIVLIVTGPFWGGSFLMMAVPPYAQAMSALYKIFGFELGCSDLHGGWRCRLRKSEPAAPGTPHVDVIVSQQFGCQSDGDCFVGNGGTCVTGSVLAQELKAMPNQGQCRCEKGPVFFGCVPLKD